MSGCVATQLTPRPISLQPLQYLALVIKSDASGAGANSVLGQLATSKVIGANETKLIRTTMESYLQADKMKLFKKLCALEDEDDITDSLTKRVIAAVYNLEEGGVLALPTGYFDSQRNRQAMLWFIRRDVVGKGRAPTYQVTLVVTGPGASFVDSMADENPPHSKLKQRGATVIPGLTQDRVTDPAFWTAALVCYTTAQSAEPYFKVLIPWLAEQSLDRVLAASANLEHNTQPRTLQYSPGIDFYKTLKHGILYALRQAGVSADSVKYDALAPILRVCLSTN